MFYISQLLIYKQLSTLLPTQLMKAAEASQIKDAQVYFLTRRFIFNQTENGVCLMLPTYLAHALQKDRRSVRESYYLLNALTPRTSYFTAGLFMPLFQACKFIWLVQMAHNLGFVLICSNIYRYSLPQAVSYGVSIEKVNVVFWWIYKACY